MSVTVAKAPHAPQSYGPRVWLQIGGSVVGLGLLADVLFNGTVLGLNVPLWVGSLIAAFILAARRSGTPVGRLSAGLLVPSFGLSVMVAWRSAAAVQVLLLTASAILLLLALVAQDDSRARRASVTLFLVSLVLGALLAARGVVLLPRSIPWRKWLDRCAQPQARAVGRAVLIAVPLVLIFGALFFAADAIFEVWIRNALTVDLTSMPGHLGWVAGGAAVAAGTLWSGLAPEQAVPSGPQLADERRLRSVETGIVLGSLASLFAVFVAIQVQYLFGGADHVQASVGLTYAEYARRGFFELVAVAALLLPVLLVADWARERNRRSLTTFRILAGLLVLLLIVVMTSAFQRMTIYVDAFGLTELRLYVTAFLGWLAMIFVWLFWSLLKERRDQFVAGAVVTALVAVVALVAVNPHGTIAAMNLSRAEQGRDFDTAHALGLSADATPTLVTGIDVLSDGDACEVARSMLERWDGAELELRAWNWGRSSARAAVESERERLLSACR